MVIASLIQTLKNHGRLTSEKTDRPINISHVELPLLLCQEQVRDVAIGVAEISQLPFLDLNAIDQNRLPLKFLGTHKPDFAFDITDKAIGSDKGQSRPAAKDYKIPPFNPSLLWR